MVRLIGRCVEVQPLSRWYSCARPYLFLGGAIDNGFAWDWQRVVRDAVSDIECTVLNPRRDDWVPDASEVVVREQIDWELDAQHAADLRVYVFPDGTLAPITLMELGLFARRAPVRVYVGCGYWRRVNVERVCERYGVPCDTDWDNFVWRIRQDLECIKRNCQEED